MTPGGRLVAAVALLAAVGGAALLSDALWLRGKAALAQVLLIRAWERVRAGEPAPRPWPWADTVPVARLRVPALGVDTVVLAGARGESLAFAPGHLGASARPGGAGPTVIAGHRDTHFAFLRALEPGHRVSLTGTDGRRWRYRVTERRVVDSRRQRLRLGTGGPRLVLLTCYPFDAVRAGGPLRLLVTAVPVATDSATFSPQTVAALPGARPLDAGRRR